jgi:hypothetical protein
VDGLDNVLSTLGVAFDAAIARDEEVAAADLAISLRQDRNLRDRLLREGPWRLVLGDTQSPAVDLVGADFVGAGPFLVPLARAVAAKAAEGVAARPSPVTLHEVLRGLARARSAVAVSDGGHEWSGFATLCGRDYLALESRGGDVLVPLTVIAWLRLSRAADVTW